MTEQQRKSKDALKAQLAGYSQGAREQIDRPEIAAGLKKWAFYSAAAGSALAAAAAADAAIIYSGVQDIMSGPVAASQSFAAAAQINVDGVGGPELQLQAGQLNGAFGVGRLYGIGGAQIARQSNSTFGIKDFQQSQTVGPGNSFNSAAFAAATQYAATFGGGDDRGVFQNSVDGFAGFRFNPGDGNHYGWIRLHLEDTDGNGLTDKITARDWAYQSAIDTPIHVADIGVPEPGSLTIFGLALGCAALPALRRRRQLQKEAAGQASA